MCHRNLLELVSAELEVQVVQGRVRLEAPGQRAHEIVVEASEAPLLEEQVDPSFKNVRANIQVLYQKRKNQSILLVNRFAKNLSLGMGGGRNCSECAFCCAVIVEITYLVVDRAFLRHCRHEFHTKRIVDILGKLLVSSHPIGSDGVSKSVSNHSQLICRLKVFSDLQMSKASMLLKS